MKEEAGENRNFPTISEQRDSQVEHLKKISSEAELDSILMGFGLAMIEDDENVLLGIYLKKENFSSEEAVDAKKGLLERMDWEVNFDHLPEEVKKKVLEVRERIEKLDFGDREEFQKAYETWQKKLKNWLEEEIEKRERWKNSSDAYWNIFINLQSNE